MKMTEKKQVGLIGLGNINREVVSQITASAHLDIRWIIDRSFHPAMPAPTEVKAAERYAAKAAAYQQLLQHLAEHGRADEHPIVVQDLAALQQLPIAQQRVDAIIEATGGDVLQYVDYKRTQLDTPDQPVLFVSANKMMVAKHLTAFFDEEHAQDVRIEAAVAAGLPLIRSLSEHISADQVKGIVAILNGTTNFILDEMEQAERAGQTLTYETALDQAIAKGYAEPGGKGDVDGQDAVYKLIILSRIAYGAAVQPTQVLEWDLIRGIDDAPPFDRVRGIDFAYARRCLGCTIKLVAIAEINPETPQTPTFLVHPMLVPLETNLGQITGPDNYIEVYSQHLGYTNMQGQGAGPAPTACALVADALSGCKNTATGFTTTQFNAFHPADAVYFSRWMVRMSCFDHAGVLAHLFKHLEHYEIGIDEVFQLHLNATEQQAWQQELAVATDAPSLTPFVFTTTRTSLGQLKRALLEMPLDVQHNQQLLFPQLPANYAIYPILPRITQADGIKRFMIA